MARSRLAAALSACALALASTGHAAPWMPLVTGTAWEYRTPSGLHQVESITGFTTIHGRAVAIKHYAEGADAGLENYWLLAADGSVLLAGFRAAGGGGLVYEPPIRILPVPPVVGPRPTVLTKVYNLLTDDELFLSPLRFDVVQAATLTLPAGAFSAVASGQYVALPVTDGVVGRQRALDGRVIDTNARSIFYYNSMDWYSEGVGLVQYNTTDPYQLVHFDLPTPTASSSWAALKRLYR